MEQVWFAITISEEKFQVHVSGEIVEVFDETSVGVWFWGVGRNFKPFESKVLS